MKRFLCLSNVCGLLALLMSAAIITAAISCRNLPPVLAEKNPAVPHCVSSLLESAARGDFAAVEAQLLGNPRLELERQDGDSLESLLWQQYLASMSCSLEGALYATDSGLAQDVTVTHLNTSAAALEIGPVARQLLQQAVDTAEDPDTLLDSDGGYRQELVDQILLQAARQTLTQPPMTQTRLTLNLRYQDGQWYVQPDDALLRILSGGIPE